MTAMRCVVVLLVVLVMACGPVSSSSGGGDDDDGDAPGDGADDGTSDSGGGGGGGSVPYKSGSRIKMRMLTTPDGAKIFQGNYDVMLDTPCTFREASDGVTRCLPTAGASSNYFANNTCTVMATFAGCGSVPRYLLKFSSDNCSFKAEVYAVSPTPLTGPVYSLSGTSCQQSAGLPGFTAHSVVGAELPPTMFQSATLGVE